MTRQALNPFIFVLPMIMAATIIFGGLTAAFSQTTAEPAETVEPAPTGPASIEERMGLEPPKPAQPDLAFGAFQRGMYLTAFELALPRANAGDPAAQTLIAELYDKGLGVAKDEKEATNWYGIAARNGNREAQFSYAVKLLEGKHVARDEKAAIKLMQAAADAGHAAASFNFGQQILKENPGRSGFRKALPYFENAAEAGIADAFYTLAVYYQKGLGDVVPNPKTARNWLIRAARSGHDTAQIELAISLANGENSERDERSAIAWLQLAAAKGNPIAQNRLARMLVLGIGTKPNTVEAAKWHILASRAGKSDLWLDEFMQNMDPKKKIEAFAAANRWPR